MKKPNLQETKSARVMQVIETVSLAGDGTDANTPSASCWMPSGTAAQPFPRRATAT